ncbi:hypothetical protein [Nitrospira sp. KM1]|uniref:hypothetical protein n=1 Tax=Nitrospira sp. KM1 TaxID=1936990 RepID=UPI001563C648|nr:hypothetical protein [Nitrospira sp. KM1]
MKEEETVSVVSRYDQPISQTPSNVSVITDEDIRQFGATDIPTLLRRIRVATNPPLPPITTSILGRSNLAPEQIISYDAGDRSWYFNHRMKIRADGFFSHLSDLISVRNQSPSVSAYSNDQGSADIYGAETGVDLLVTRWLTGFANYSYDDIRQYFTGLVRRGGPHNKFNVGLRGEWETGISAEALYHYYGSALSPPEQSFADFAQQGLVPLPDPTGGAYNLLNLRTDYRFRRHKAAAGYPRDAEVAVSASMH